MHTLSRLWRRGRYQEKLGTKGFSLPRDRTENKSFIDKYDKNQQQLQELAAMDELLSGRVLPLFQHKAGTHHSRSKKQWGILPGLTGRSFGRFQLLNVQKTFSYRGGKDAALQAMKNLEDDGLGKLEERKPKAPLRYTCPTNDYTWNLCSDHCTLGRNYAFVLRNLYFWGNWVF